MRVENVSSYIKICINEFLRKFFVMPSQKKKLKNRDFSIIASNCNGCVLTHDLGVRFMTPTVNLSMSAGDYLKFVKNMDYYLKAKIIEQKNSATDYPVGILGENIVLHFIHYKSFDEAVKKWDERKRRINKRNMFFMMTDRDGCTEEDIREFDSLPYRNKIIFTAKEYPQYKSTIFCKEFSGQTSVPILTEWRSVFGERLYDRYFDFVKWLNGE